MYILSNYTINGGFMKKRVKSLIAISLAVGILVTNITTVIYANETLENTVEIQPDPIDIIDYSMGGNLNYKTSPSSLEELSVLKNSVSSNAIGSGIVNADTLNVRKGSSTAYEKIGTLSGGDFVEIYGRSNGWYKVSFNNQIGYVSASYITLNVIEKGIDVSKHNGSIDWNKVKADGIDYAIIRGGYGNSYVDPYFKDNIEGATKAGLKVGVYWFSYSTSVEKARQEAEKCLEVISPYKDKITYPVFYDFEYASVDYAAKQGVTVTKSLATDMANTFINRIASAGYDTGLYSNQDFSSRYFDTSILNSNNLWIAQYTSKCTYSKPYMMWQYSEKGSVNGIKGNVDLNYTCLKSMKYDNEEITQSGYRLNIHSFLGESNAKSALEKLQKTTGWYAQYHELDSKEHYYQIRTGGFVGEDNVKSALQTLYNTTGLTGSYIHEGDYYGSTRIPIYRIETGGFYGEDNVKAALKVLQDDTGWWATYTQHGSDPNMFKIVTGGFVGEDSVKSALKSMQDRYGWWAQIVPNGDYYESQGTPIYHIYIKGFLGENNVIESLNNLKQKTGWWAEYHKSNDYISYYQIITRGFSTYEEAQKQSKYITDNFGWYNTIFKD